MQRAPEISENSTILRMPAIASAASQIFYWSAIENDPLRFLGRAVPLISQTIGSEYVALVQGSRGRWRTIASSGPERSPPTELLSESLDTGQVIARGDWNVSPLSPQSRNGELLVAYLGAGKLTNEREPERRVVEEWLATGLEQVRARHRDKQQIVRQSALLEITASWTRTLQMDKLLSQLAQTATRLLSAERASIFL